MGLRTVCRWASWVAFGAATACSSPKPRPPLEDAARRVTPVPACVAAARGRSAGGARRALREPELWGLVFPTFDSASYRVPADASACNRQLSVRDLLGGSQANAWVKVPQGSLVYGGGEDRLKVVWLPLAQTEDGADRGALALLRSFDDTAELYAVGVHQGRRPTASFGLQRLGNEPLVIANDDGCRASPAAEPATACVTSARLYADRQGLLREVAHFDLQRVAFGHSSEPGLGGDFVYRLTATPTFGPDGVRLHEQVKVSDSLGREVRSAELERRYTMGPGGTMLPSDDPLWQRVYAAAAPR